MTVLPAVASGLEDLLGELSRTLWKQRGLIEMLHYRLEVQQLIFASAKTERLQLAVEEVESAMDDIRRSERTRDTVVKRCAAALELPASASLADIRAGVEDPWAMILADHQDALLSLVNEAERLAALNREFALRGANDARALLEEVAGSKPTASYGPAPARGLIPPTLLDQDA